MPFQSIYKADVSEICKKQQKKNKNQASISKVTPCWTQPGCQTSDDTKLLWLSFMRYEGEA